MKQSVKEARSLEFIEIAGTSPAEATRILKLHAYRLQPALDAFYNDPAAMRLADAHRAAGKGGQSAKKLNKLWEKYRDSTNAEETDVDGTIRYCDDLGISPDDVVMLAIAWYTKAPTMGRFRRESWVDAWKASRNDTIELQREYVDTLRNDLKSSDTFRQVYNFTFDYAKNEGQKSMMLDVASDLWTLLVPLDPTANFSAEHLEWWIDFLVRRGSKAVSKDTWILFLEFTRTIDPEFSQHDEEAAWPSVIDDFVDFARARLLKGKMDVA